MSSPLAQLRSAVDNLPQGAATTEFRGSTLPFDAAWAPAVPPGHTSYTWIGHHNPRYDVSPAVLGCVRPEGEAAAAPVAAAPAPVAAEAEAAQQPKKQKQPKQQQAAPAAAAAPVDAKPTVAHLAELHFIVGQIVSCKKHDGADSLYVEQIDLGPVLGQRQIVSGLVKYLTLEQMIGSRVVVVANLKPSALRGEMSSGMVLAAGTADKSSVVLVQPPESAQLGDRIVPVDATIQFNEPVAEVNPKKKNNVWGIVAPELRTNADGQVAFGDILLGTVAGPATASLKDAIVS